MIFQMMGVLGWSWDQVVHLSYRQLAQAHDAVLANQWDQTATLATLLDGLVATTANAWGKRKVKPRGFYTFHPYRKNQQRGLRITPENMNILKTLGDHVFSRRPKKR
jgi:hypothetical protein